MEETLTREVVKVYKGLILRYEEEYCLGYKVNEETMMVNKNIIVPYYTKSQLNRDLKKLKELYLAQLN